MKFKHSSKKMATRSLLLAFMVISLGHKADAGVMESRRCTNSPDREVNAEQAKGRVAWARKCYPHLRSVITKGETDAVDLVSPKGKVIAGYPTFAATDADGNVIKYWEAPKDPSASCEHASQYNLIGFCRAGCYTPDQFVLFDQGYKPIGTADGERRVVTLTSDATLDDLSYQATPLKSLVKSLVPGKHEILIIDTASGGQLKVTVNHPLVDSEGRMRAARDLEVGENLVNEAGSPDPIISITKKKYFGRVYNVELTKNISAKRVVLAQGYLNGTMYYQNQGVAELNRKLLRNGNLLNEIVQ